MPGMDVAEVRAPAGRVTQALQNAAAATGVDFDYLLRTAQRESALDPRAQARTSSAAGLFQFLDQTWLATLSRHGERHGYGQLARMISNEGGRYRVSGEGRAAVMALRLDPQASALMAAEMTSDSASYLRGRIGRDPTGGELYAAHFLGPAGCARLIQACQNNPQVSAASLFPDAAAANRSIFYRDGRPASVTEVYANLMRRHEGGPAVAARPEGPVDRVQVAAPAPADAAERTPTLAAALARIRAQQAMVAMILGQGSGSLPFSPTGSHGNSPLQALLGEAEGGDSAYAQALAQTAR